MTVFASYGGPCWNLVYGGQVIYALIKYDFIALSLPLAYMYRDFCYNKINIKNEKYKSLFQE